MTHRPCKEQIIKENEKFEPSISKNSHILDSNINQVSNLESNEDKAKVDEGNETGSSLDLYDAGEHNNEHASWQTNDNGQPRGILKRCVRRCFSESHATSQASVDNLAWSNSIFDAISGTVPESSSSSTSSEDNRMSEDVTSHKKSVRFNEVVQRQIFRSNIIHLKE